MGGRLRGEDEVRKHLAQIEETIVHMYQGSRARRIEDPVLEHRAREVAASVAGYPDHIVAAKVLTLGEMITLRVERQIGREEALKYASAIMRRVAHLVLEQRRAGGAPAGKKAPARRRTRGALKTR